MKCEKCPDVEFLKGEKYSIAWYCHKYKKFLHIQDNRNIKLIKVIKHKGCNK